MQKEEGLSSGLNRSTESSSPPLSKRPRRPLPLPSPPGELRLLNPTRWAGLHGSLLARRHHPNLPREAPVTSHPRARAASDCSQRWDAQSLWHLEPGCERKGRPLQEPHPRPWNIWVRGGWGFSTPDVVLRPPAVRAPSLGQAAGESGWTRGRGWDFSLLTDFKTGGLSSPVPGVGLLTLTHTRSNWPNVGVSRAAPHPRPGHLFKLPKPAQEIYSYKINPVSSSADPWSWHWDSSCAPGSSIWVGGGEEGYTWSLP